MSIVGIDLGTSNSAIAVTNSMGITTTIAGRDGSRIVPSAVYFEPSGDVIVGSRARSMAVMEPNRVAMLFKRGMGEPTFLSDGSNFTVDGRGWRPEELSSLVLKKLKAIAEEALNEPVTGAIVTVPAYFGELERAATREAAELAGLPLLRIINEPTAAAIAHGLDVQSRDTKILVFDLGGGTFDVTVMKIDGDGAMAVLATGGNHKLGGSDFDAIILQMMADEAQREVGVDILAEDWMFADARDKAEEIKKELSTAPAVSRPIQTGARPFMYMLTREQFEAALADTIEDVSDMVEVTLGESGLERGDIDTILMVGGSARIPAFASLLRRTFSKEPTFSANLDEDVARGASILATKVSGTVDYRSELAELAIPTDIASHGLGITVVSNGRDVNAIVVPAGASVPAAGEETFYALEDGQTGVRLRINEGDEEDLRYCRLLGEGDADFGRPVLAEHPIRIRISYNEEQIVDVQAFDGVTGDHIGQVRIKREGTMSDDDRRTAKAAISARGIS